MLDLQQLHTGLIDRSQIAHRVLASVISYYPGRGEDGVDEAMCDAGAIAMSKDTGPTGGFGDVIGKPWRLKKISQEHGILTQLVPPESGSLAEDYGTEQLELGTMIEIVGQHACLIAAAHPWFYVVDSSVEGGSDHVQDIWIPWKGWWLQYYHFLSRHSIQSKRHPNCKEAIVAHLADYVQIGLYHEVSKL